MPTRITNSNGTFLAGIADDFTGEDARYKKVTKWIDGSPMSDARCDGKIFRKVGSEYFKRAGVTRVNVFNLGLFGEGERIEDLLNEQFRKLSPWTEFYFPEGTYTIGPSQNTNLSNIPVGLDWGTSGASITGAGRGTVFNLLPGCVGFQLNGGLVKGVPVLRDFDLTGPGRESATDGRVTNVGPFLSNGIDANPDAGRTMGDWSRIPNNYQYSGINAWCQAILEGINVRSCSGHGVWVQGYIGLKAQGPKTSAAGTFINSNRFRLDDPGLAGSFTYGTKVELGSAKGFVGGVESNGDISLDVSQDGNVAFPASGHYTVVSYTMGSDLIADNGLVHRNCNFDFNGGAGFYIQGSDGNQWNMFGGSVRENGLEGVLDGSFLGFFAWGTHGSGNGRHINKFQINGVIGNDLLLVGSFRTTDVNAFSGWYNCYSEGGNQGPLIAPYRTMVLGGTHESGITGGCFVQRGVDANTLKVGDLILSAAQNELILRFGTNDTPPLRLRRFGPGYGTYGFGITNSSGDTFFDIWSLPLPGATVSNGAAGGAARTRPVIPKAVGPACYTSYRGIKKTQSALSLSAYLSRPDPIADLAGDYLEVEQGSGAGGFGPLRYRCAVGGSSPQYVPDDYGVGTDAQRPPTLLATDASYRWFSTTSKTYSTWNGTAWV